jgi:hypothetical protein
VRANSLIVSLPVDKQSWCDIIDAFFFVAIGDVIKPNKLRPAGDCLLVRYSALHVCSAFMAMFCLPCFSPQDNQLDTLPAERKLGNTILVKLKLWELDIVFNKTFWSATNLCLRYASAKCGR